MTKKKPGNMRIREIIQAAVEEFLEKGYNGASMNSIAARAGLSKGGLYHHFSGKDEILMAANDEFARPVHDLVHRTAAVDNPVEALTLYIREYLHHWSTHEKELAFTFLTMTKIISCREMWPQMEDYSTGVVAFYESLFKKGIEKGLLRHHDTAARALTLMAALDGITAYLVMGHTFPLEKTVEHFLVTYIGDIEIK